MTPSLFSLIIPTRNRTHSLRLLLDSLKAKTRDTGRLEIVLVCDKDDQESLDFRYSGLVIKNIDVEPGLTMGQLNMSGYRASTGRYVMLLNDDVIVKTPGWDDTVLEALGCFQDGIVLIHVNELIFQNTLCTFPLLSRRFCELAGGVCHEGYRRYRIDDHIHNVFDLLSLLGKNRRVFFPDVVFEHSNLEETGQGQLYVPDPEIHALDTRLFESLLPARREVALQALAIIEEHAQLGKQVERRQKLEQVTDSVTIRFPEHGRLYPFHEPPGGARPRVTVGVVSADLRSDYAQECIARVKEHTSNYELVLLDNNHGPGFNHAHEMNRIVDFCGTDYLALLDDDVFVEPGWLEGLLRCCGPSIGVVTPMHMDKSGCLSYAGVVMQPDDSGHHTHVMDANEKPHHIQTLCSAIMLIDMSKCGHLRFGESYTKYFMDIDYGLRVWEEGLRVLCSPYSRVTHLGGATLEQGSQRSSQLFEEQRRHYVRSWVESGRLRALKNGPWNHIAEFQVIASKTREIDRFFQETPSDPATLFERGRAVIRGVAAYPALKNYIIAQARTILDDRQARVDRPEIATASMLLGLAGIPVLYEAGVDDLNIVLWNSTFYAVPMGEGPFEYSRIRAGDYKRSFEADDLRILKQLIRQFPKDTQVGHVCRREDASVTTRSRGNGSEPAPVPATSRRGRGGNGHAGEVEERISILEKYIPNAGELHVLRDEVLQLEERLVEVRKGMSQYHDRLDNIEQGLTGIYHSRTWQALTGCAKVMQRFIRVGGRKP